MKITDHRLDDSADLNVEFSTPNVGGEFASGLPDTIVIHFTAGSSAKSSVRHLCKPSARASAHLVVGRAGETYQLAPFNVITWHAGRSRWKGRSGLNKHSIGIEIDNPGRLEQTGEGTFKTWFGKTVDASDVFQDKHRNESTLSFWQSYTEAQITQVFDICELLVEHYDIKDIVGHEEISPSRKTDPGPAFPLERLRDRFLGESRQSEEDDFISEDSLGDIALVNAGKLNIRSGPGVGFPVISEPIRRGDSVKLLDSSKGWAQVEYTKKGWVSAQYLKFLDGS